MMGRHGEPIVTQPGGSELLFLPVVCPSYAAGVGTSSSGHRKGWAVGEPHEKQWVSTVVAF